MTAADGSAGSPRPRPLRVAAVQAVSAAGDVDTNVRTAARLTADAAARGARVVVLPELFLSGYDPATLRRDSDGCDLTVHDPRLEPLRTTCRSHRVVCVVGASVRRENGRRTLSLVVVDDAGAASAPYDKQHLWHEERGIFAAGDHGATLGVDGWDLGMGICYDGCFPEHARTAADDGALAYLCPSAYVVGSEHRRDLYYAARALDNGFYVVVAGLTGRCGELDFSGGSAVYDPEGQPVARAGGDSEEVVVADLDAATVDSVRSWNSMRADRVDRLGPRLRVEASAPGAGDRKPVTRTP